MNVVPRIMHNQPAIQVMDKKSEILNGNEQLQRRIELGWGLTYNLLAIPCENSHQLNKILSR